MSYEDFLNRKRQLGGDHGFDPVWMPEFLFPFQQSLVEWTCRKGRGALLVDCGLGKSPMQLVWASNVNRKTGGPVLIATPLAVSEQLIREADKFGIDATRSQDGSVPDGARIVVTNYERLAAFNPRDFAGMVCDESSILKNFNGVRKQEITDFMRKMRYRLLCTATAAPNDYTELGTSSEALGELGHMDMLGRFFTNKDRYVGRDGRGGFQRHRSARSMEKERWRFKGHSQDHFWRWVCSWARACRAPSDLGYDDNGFILPALHEHEHIVKARTKREGWLLNLPATNFHEEREERRRTIQERCEKVAELAATNDQVLVWCHMNDEGNRLTKLIDGAVQVQGSDSDEDKASRLLAFADGDIRVLVTKPKIGAWGLNLQGCAHITFFPSHSYEQYYQGIRRCWRFGQKRPVRVDLVATDGEIGVKENLQRKAKQADLMFTALVAHMNDALKIDATKDYTKTEEVPAWLS